MEQERRRHRPLPGVRHVPTMPGPTGDGAAAETDAVDTGAAMVRIIHGIEQRDGLIAGTTVAQARAMFADELSLQEGIGAVVDGEDASDDTVLREGNTLEFVHRTGEKGAAATEIVVVGGNVVVRNGGRNMMEMPVTDFVQRVGASREFRPGCDILPGGVRWWIQRGETVGLAIEVPPGPRSVLWLADDSPAPFGDEAVYQQRYLSFPYVEILLVVHGGELTGQQQLFYRRRPLGDDDSLLLPNLLNVSPNAYGQTAWLCLANLRSVGALTWHGKVDAVVQHTFSAKFNRSSEEHEGNSYWQLMRDVDPRVSSAQAWHDATRADRRFALEVKWKGAERGLKDELTSMVESVHAASTPGTADELAGVLAAGSTGRRRRRSAAQEELF